MITLNDRNKYVIQYVYLLQAALQILLTVILDSLDWTGKTRTESMICKTRTHSVRDL